MQRRILSIGGGTCSGKTSLAAGISRALRPGASAIVSLDSYYRDLSHLPMEERAAQNFDHPDAFDWPLLAEHVEALAESKTVEVPQYDFCTHRRLDTTRIVEPAPLIMFEGLLALHDRTLRDFSDLRIYLHADDATCLTRRIQRDTSDRGRTDACVRAQYEVTVRPMAERFVMPTRAYADLELNGAVALETLVDFVLGWLPQSLRL